MFNSMAVGYYNWLLFNKQTKKVANYSKSPKINMLLDPGLNNISSSVWADNFLYCFIGNGSSAEVASQTSLDNQLYSTNTYFVESGANKKEVLSNAIKLTRTFSFNNLNNGDSISELGVGPNATSDLFSRLKLDSPIVVGTQEALLVQYNLIIYFDPASNRKLNDIIEGVTSSGTLCFQFDGLAGINGDGTTNYNSNLAQLCNEPSQVSRFFFSTVFDPPASFGNAVDRIWGTTWENDCVLENYTLDSFYRDKKISIDDSTANQNWNSLGLGFSSNPEVNTGLIFVFDQAFQKNTYFNLTFRYKWGRLPIPPIEYEEDKSSLLFYFLGPEEMVNLKQNPLLTYFSSE